jgi:hypothetical protein
MANDLEVQRALGRIEAKVDILLVEQALQHKDIDSLKRWRAWVLGAAASVAMLVSYLFP